jgi:hypothetical protein
MLVKLDDMFTEYSGISQSQLVRLLRPHLPTSAEQPPAAPAPPAPPPPAPALLEQKPCTKDADCPFDHVCIQGNCVLRLWPPVTPELAPEVTTASAPPTAPAFDLIKFLTDNALFIGLGAGVIAGGAALIILTRKRKSD